MKLVLGPEKFVRLVEDVEKKLVQYRENADGIFYLNHQPSTPPDRVVTEDISITVIVNAVWTLRALKDSMRSIEHNASSLDFSCLPKKPLEQTNSTERDTLARFIERIANWKNFAVSTATKLLHKKRPGLIPILDNREIFGAYLNPDWPKCPSARGQH